MSEQTDATEDRADDDLDIAREDREKLVEGSDADEPQPWAKPSPGDDG